MITTLPNVMVFNVCLSTADHTDPQMTAWDRLINRVERTMLELERIELPVRRGLSDRATTQMGSRDGDEIDRRLNIYRSRAVILADEGREIEITRALRKMHVFNPIPSRLGGWESGQYTKNITTDRIIEDPVFKDSARSYLTQLADCAAFALLKREVPPTPLIQKYGIDNMFDNTLRGVCYKKAAINEPLGIVRY